MHHSRDCGNTDNFDRLKSPFCSASCFRDAMPAVDNDGILLRDYASRGDCVGESGNVATDGPSGFRYIGTIDINGSR